MKPERIVGHWRRRAGCSALRVAIYGFVAEASGMVGGLLGAFLTAGVIAVGAVVLSTLMRKTEGAAHPAAH